MFTARTTWVSNPFCAPSLHPSLSDPSSQDAFASVSPPKINIFYHFLECTSCVFRSRAPQYLLHAWSLRDQISQETYGTSYECFRPNNCGCDLDCWDYRGGWHQSLPVLIRLPFYSKQKLFKKNNTLTRSVTLACIAENTRLLHPLGLGIVSQIPSQGLSAKSPYWSKVWWAITPPTA